MARRRYLVAYDIREDRRLRDVARCMEAHEERVQYSVFVCDLSRRELGMMCMELEQLTRISEDSIMLVDLGDTQSATRFSFLGRPTGLTRARRSNRVIARGLRFTAPRA